MRSYTFRVGNRTKLLLIESVDETHHKLRSWTNLIYFPSPDSIWISIENYPLISCLPTMARHRKLTFFRKQYQKRAADLVWLHHLISKNLLNLQWDFVCIVKRRINTESRNNEVFTTCRPTLYHTGKKADKPTAHKDNWASFYKVNDDEFTNFKRWTAQTLFCKFTTIKILAFWLEFLFTAIYE